MKLDIRTIVPGLEELSDEEARGVDQILNTQSFAKGDVLIQPGTQHPKAYVVVEGCVRSYWINDGEEATVELYVPGEFCTDISAFGKDSPTRITLECISKCVLIPMTLEQGLSILEKAPRFMELCRIRMEDDFSRYQMRMAGLIGESSEERYLKLMAERPEVLQLAPLRIIANYLGIQPESLSRIRRKLAGSSS